MTVSAPSLPMPALLRTGRRALARIRGFGWLSGILLLIAASGIAAAADPRILLVHDGGDALSTLDARGIREALQAQRIPVRERALALGEALQASELAPHPVLVLAHVALDPATAAEVLAWVQAGGGLVATGRSGFGLEAALGITALQPVARFPAGGPAADAIRFATAHPVATGSFWSGPISQTPPMPPGELPTIPQLLYPNASWPAYTATPAGGEALARWRQSSAPWGSLDQAPALYAHRYGSGRTVYLGALPGAYADQHWPLTWQTLVQETVEWTRSRGPSVQLGEWPDGHIGAFALSADTERAAMSTVVPALLARFQRLGLQDFGTFFVVGQAGGDPLTEGAFEHPEVVAAIVAAGAEVGGHGDIHRGFAGQLLAEQQVRLGTMRTLIEAHTGGRPLLGFRAPGLSIDRNTWRALAASGLAYDSSDQDVWCECSLPWFNGEVWSLPPTAPMDYSLLYTQGLLDAEWASIMRDKFAYIGSRHGLVNWVIHPWIAGGHLDTIESLLAEVRDAGEFWMARLDHILAWWIQREALRLDLVESGPFVLRLALANDGAEAVDGATLWLRLPATAQPWRAFVDGEEVTRGRRTHGLANPSEFETLVVPRIAAGARADIELVVERPRGIFTDGFEP